jgi:hypothetical protein
LPLKPNNQSYSSFGRQWMLSLRNKAVTQPKKGNFDHEIMEIGIICSNLIEKSPPQQSWTLRIQPSHQHNPRHQQKTITLNGFHNNSQIVQKKKFLIKIYHSYFILNSIIRLSTQCYAPFQRNASTKHGT